MSIAVELAAFNENCHTMGAQNIIDASLCLQNFDSMSQPDQEVVPATLPEHHNREEKSSELTVERAQDRLSARNIELRSRALGDPTPATSSTLASPVTQPMASAPLEVTREPSSSGKKKPRKLNQKSQSTEKRP